MDEMGDERCPLNEFPKGRGNPVLSIAVTSLV